VSQAFATSEPRARPIADAFLPRSTASHASLCAQEPARFVTVAHVVAKRHKARERQRSVAGARGELGGRERPRRGIVRAR